MYTHTSVKNIYLSSLFILEKYSHDKPNTNYTNNSFKIAKPYNNHFGNFLILDNFICFPENIVEAFKIIL